MEKFEPTRYLGAVYSLDNESEIYNASLFLHMLKLTNKNTKKIEETSHFMYKGIRCTFVDDVRPDYQLSTEGNWTYDDIEKEPKGIINQKHIIFEIDNIRLSATYSISSNKSEFDNTVTERFVKDHIDLYLNK